MSKFTPISLGVIKVIKPSLVYSREPVRLLEESALYQVFPSSVQELRKKMGCLLSSGHGAWAELQWIVERAPVVALQVRYHAGFSEAIKPGEVLPRLGYVSVYQEEYSFIWGQEECRYGTPWWFVVPVYYSVESMVDLYEESPDLVRVVYTEREDVAEGFYLHTNRRFEYQTGWFNHYLDATTREGRKFTEQHKGMWGH